MLPSVSKKQQMATASGARSSYLLIYIKIFLNASLTSQFAARL